jgi:alpha-1,6-mannosyltransferase
VRNWKINKFYEFSDIVKATSIFLAIAWIAYPVSSDIYLYLQYGLMGLNKVNPYLISSGNFASELSPFIFWDQTSTYGPISQLFFMAAAFFLSFNTILGIYIFKLICLLAHLLNSYLIWRQLKLSPHQQIITITYLINPLLLFEQATEAHIDVFVCTSIILLIKFFKNRNIYKL